MKNWAELRLIRFFYSLGNSTIVIFPSRRDHGNGELPQQIQKQNNQRRCRRNCGQSLSNLANWRIKSVLTDVRKRAWRWTTLLTLENPNPKQYCIFHKNEKIQTLGEQSVWNSTQRVISLESLYQEWYFRVKIGSNAKTLDWWYGWVNYQTTMNNRTITLIIHFAAIENESGNGTEHSKRDYWTDWSMTENNVAGLCDWVKQWSICT